MPSLASNPCPPPLLLLTTAPLPLTQPGLRLWDLRKVSDTCRLQQEMSTHRPKWEEGIRSVAIHPRFPLLATGGADSGVKVYT